MGRHRAPDPDEPTGDPSDDDSQPEDFGDVDDFREPEDFPAAAQRPISGMKIAYSRNLGIYPVEKVVSAHINRAVRAFEEAGAIVEEIDPAINHSQQELSNLWCRMIAPNSLLGLERLRMQGFDLLREHPEDLPPQLHHWLEVGRGLTALDALRDQVIRSQIFASIQKVFESHDLIVTPTLACLPVDNSTDGNTVGPSSINGEAVDPLIGWCMTYLFNFTGHPAASVPAGSFAGRPADRSADHRAPAFRFRRARRERRLRARAAVAG